MEAQNTLNNKNNPEKMRNTRAITTPLFKLYYRTIGTKTDT
jgi:hypothetical protein